MSTENQAIPAGTVPQKKQITTEKLKELMLGGMNRKQIAAYYNAPVSVINKFFKHEDLKNLRPKHASDFELVDETGKTYSPGALAQAAKEAKEAEEAEVNEVTEAETETTSEVAEEIPAVSESTGI